MEQPGNPDSLEGLTMDKLCDFIYNGNLSLSILDEIPPGIQAAHRLRIQDLTEAIYAAQEDEIDSDGDYYPEDFLDSPAFD